MAKYRITTPNPIFNGVTEGVLFVNGVAIIDDEQKKYLFENDYKYTCEQIEDAEDGKERKPKASPK
ncbi:hypothetical protein H1S01_11340 [Heliobacterium chlorum]|uniref:Phage protein n=1 Tax=Heliobacterium chlorum TaxID=2698 RepID=A0ABR7T380_HELCL|nr:hypothetical protein [Heliobacterium chlorum]MBC9785101.1 hypothetical protein [Heliobacterium chlorum]